MAHLWQFYSLQKCLLGVLGYSGQILARAVPSGILGNGVFCLNMAVTLGTYNIFSYFVARSFYACLYLVRTCLCLISNKICS